MALPYDPNRELSSHVVMAKSEARAKTSEMCMSRCEIRMNSKECGRVTTN